MLVLTRKVGERIHIGDDIVVTVSAVEGNKVRIGIEAPRCLPIWREELGSARGNHLGQLPLALFGLVNAGN